MSNENEKTVAQIQAVSPAVILLFEFTFHSEEFKLRNLRSTEINAAVNGYRRRGCSPRIFLRFFLLFFFFLSFRRGFACLGGVTCIAAAAATIIAFFYESTRVYHAREPSANETIIAAKRAAKTMRSAASCECFFSCETATSRRAFFSRR